MLDKQARIKRPEREQQTSISEAISSGQRKKVQVAKMRVNGKARLADMTWLLRYESTSIPINFYFAFRLCTLFYYLISLFVFAFPQIKQEKNSIRHFCDDEVKCNRNRKLDTMQFSFSDESEVDATADKGNKKRSPLLATSRQQCVFEIMRGRYHYKQISFAWISSKLPRIKKLKYFSFVGRFSSIQNAQLNFICLRHCLRLGGFLSTKDQIMAEMRIILEMRTKHICI